MHKIGWARAALLVTLTSALVGACGAASTPAPSPVVRLAHTPTTVPTLAYPGFDLAIASAGPVAPTFTPAPTPTFPPPTSTPRPTPFPATARPAPFGALEVDDGYEAYDPPRPDNLPPTPTPSNAPPATPAPPLGSAAHMPADPTAEARVARVPILMYHYLSAPPPGADRVRQDLSVSPAAFEAQLAYLKDNGFNAIRLDDLHNHLAAGAPLPPKPVILTFDDGYRDTYENAFPLLLRYGFRATFFIVSDFVHSGNPVYMNWRMVREMSDAGMSIESHSRTHPDLRNRSFENLVWEILGPIESIEAFTGRRPRFFCYPAGRYDDAVIRVLRSVGTLGAVTTHSGKTHTLGDAMTWSRVRVRGGLTVEQFAALLN